MSAPNWILQQERVLLLVVDLQQKLMPAIFERERVQRNAVLLLRLAETLQLPAVLTTQYAAGLGPTVPEVLAAAPGHEPVDKTSFGCFGSAEFLERLNGHQGRDQLLVAGVESHVCVTQTVLAALGRGFQVHVAADATSSRREADWRLGLRRMEHAGAVVSSAEMATYELLGRADTPEFKRLLPYLRER